jgi:hypothetical protein
MSQLITTSSVDKETAQVSDDCGGFNSAILPLRHSRPQRKKDPHKYALGPTARRCLRERMTSELQEVIRFFCLDLGCQHAHDESYLAMGGLDICAIVGTQCDNSCSTCMKRWHKIFLPVYHSSVEAFLEFLMQTGKFPQQIDYKSLISNLLATSAFGRRQCLIGHQVESRECTWTHCSSCS